MGRERERISLCMIARDEEQMLGGCLDSVRDDADEILLVDTGSLDRTPQIARSLGARVLPAPWTNDFAAARNHGLEQATGEWILVLDCDERLDPGSRGLVRRAATGGQKDTYLLRLVNVGGEQWQALRLFRNLPGVRYEGRIHEQLVYPGAPRPSGIAHGVAILHLGYQVSVMQQRNKQSRNMQLIEASLAETAAGHPSRHSFYLFYYAFGSQGRERGERLERWVSFVEANPMLQRDPVAPCIPVGLAHYAWALSDSGAHADAEARSRALLKRYGEYPVLRLCIARARASAGDFEQAEKELVRLSSAADIYRHFPLDYSLVERRGMRLLGEIREMHGRLAEAEHCYRTVLASEPGHLPALLRLACLLAQKGDYQQALQALESSPALLGQGLPEVDCLGFALALILQSPERIPIWGPRVQARAHQSPLAARILERVSQWRVGASFQLSDFPELEEGVKLRPNPGAQARRTHSTATGVEPSS